MKTFKKICVEERLASMMHASSPRALRFGTLFASVRLALFETKVWNVLPLENERNNAVDGVPFQEPSWVSGLRMY